MRNVVERTIDVRAEQTRAHGLGADVADQVVRLPRAERDIEEALRDFREVMRLVDDDGVGARNSSRNLPPSWSGQPSAGGD